jgi:hypothetical protein
MLLLVYDGRRGALCLRRMAAVAAARGDAGWAARLAGAAAALRSAIGMQPAAGSGAVEQHIATARVTLGDAEFTGAWEAGRALSLEEATAEALSVPL